MALCMLRIAVLLEINGAAVEIMFVGSAEKGFGENIGINDAIHDPFDAVQFTYAMPCDTPPGYDAPAIVLDLFFRVPSIIGFPFLPPTPFPAIRSQNVEFGIIGKYDRPPILLRPITMMSPQSTRFLRWVAVRRGLA